VVALVQAQRAGWVLLPAAQPCLLWAALRQLRLRALQQGHCAWWCLWLWVWLLRTPRSWTVLGAWVQVGRRSLLLPHAVLQLHSALLLRRLLKTLTTQTAWVARAQVGQRPL
jgi:hypothetical protein